MSSSSPVERMRAAISTQLQHLGVQTPVDLHETLLIRNGLFCGRKFQCEGHLVVWFVEEDEIKFFSPCGELLKTASAIECLAALDSKQQSSQHSQRRAA